MIKAAVIGTGFIGPTHVESIRRLGFVEVVALCERSQDLAEAKAAELSIPKAYGDFREMLADPDIQVVHNCTPNHLHFEMNKAIIEAGKHVVSEKPLAMDTEQSRELVRLAEESGVVNAINFNYRFMPLVRQAQQMVAKGDIGKVHSVHGSYLQDWLLKETDWNWRLVPEMSGSSRAVADIGSHWCDIVQFVAGVKIKSVMADFHTIYPERKKPSVEVESFAGKQLKPEDYESVPINTEDYASSLLEFENGAHGVMTVSQCSAGKKNGLTFELDGTEASLAWDQERPNEMWIGRRDGPNETLIRDASLMYPEAQDYVHYPGGHNEGWPGGSKNLFRNVYGHIAGKRPGGDYATFVDGHNALAICEAMVKSSKERKWVDVEY
ncbi:Gfo/Idh/MocA family protein [Aeoliella mucimassa]|uniref:1,5-anhydro-D-fructose reductase n=1 Tax=Aeoliella mucimassa TaxID=2527972 RepID=A0A518AU07_9BACT|nr:Gfo/Idh/MocA family oxidoreductase [Aeoliella mucimassa]QDU58211.1 1,5-anhydro-D-fructose reductase [Aeoliella mucimassa]